MNFRPDIYWLWELVMMIGGEEGQTKAEDLEWIQQFDEKSEEAPIKRDSLVPIMGFYRHYHA